jgi:hypothetical protein
MAGRLTIWGASEVLTCFFGNTQAAQLPPGSFWLALIRQIAPTPYMSGAEIDEPDAADYARVEIPNDGFNWANLSSPQLMSNLLDVSFVTAATDWGECRFWALCNADVDGFNYLVGDLEVPILVEAGDVVTVSEGDLGVSLGPFFMTDAEDDVE